MSRLSLRNGGFLLALLAGAGGALAAETGNSAAGANPDNDIFALGKIEQVTVTASPISQALSESAVSAAESYKFNAPTVDRAIDLVPGAVSGATGGPRNEQLFFIRGFDRFQSPLFVDGIRVYLPADNRLDLRFFTTSGLAQIQVEKGYVSVLSGPGALGGAINLVTRKPSQDFEYEARAGASFAGDSSYDGYTMSGMVGTRQDDYYLQASGTYRKSDYFRLSDDFTPTASQTGFIRDHSGSREYGINLKSGWTPNDTDEYSLNYSGQWGKKAATLSVTDAVSTQKDFTWPYWNLQSLYFLSGTQLGASAYVKTRLYYDSFRDANYSFDDASYTTQTTTKAFDLYYSDYAYGGSIEAGNSFGARDILKTAFFYRRDSHTQWQTIFSPAFTEPNQTSIEDTSSLAVENRLHLTDELDLVTGASYDWRNLLKAQAYVDPTAKAAGQFVNYPVANGDVGNVQGELIYNVSDTANVYANISDRGRFPTLFDRFSTRFGATISNPNLLAERAINYEIGGSTLIGAATVSGAVFASDLANALETVPIQFCDTTSKTAHNCTGAGSVAGTLTSTMQTQNVGTGHYYGYEVSADDDIADGLRAGLRFTYINRNINAQNPANPPVVSSFHLTGVPDAQLFAYASWNALPDLSFTPNVQIDSDRWTNSTSGASYFKTGSFLLVNFEADYAVTDNLDLQFGGRNLFDANYQLVAGFPQEGRSFSIDLRIRS